ncbi:S8 family serine peptidase [Candidatus Nomurabacteria bacterium]|nr:S8 family serine peptidase [Candidatus Nomurabacteria bacterium]
MIKKIFIFSLFLVFLGLAFPKISQAWQQDYTPRDPDLHYQTYFDLINIKPSWSYQLQLNKEVVVAVLDSGVDLNHPDLENNLWHNQGEIFGNSLDDDQNSYIDDYYGWDFIDSDNWPEPVLNNNYDRTAINHGTVIAGILGAIKNSIGVVGVAPQIKIMPLRILDSRGQGNTLVLSQAINYAVENGADIINLSLVGTSYDETLKQAIKNAYDQGVMIVAASGNEENLGVDLDEYPHYPICDFDGINRVLGVAAVDQNKKLTAFSNFGETCIDISAPGSNFYSTAYQSDQDTAFRSYYSGGWSGTSVATPVVSAAAALIKMNYPQFRPNDIYQIIKNSAASLRFSNPNNFQDLGSGLLDIGAALDLAESVFNQKIFIVLAPDKGLEPRITLLNDQGAEASSFLAYNAKFTGGVNIAVGDVNGDGSKEIITAPKAGGGPHVRIFDESGNVLSEFMAYDPYFTGGVNVEVGDINGDGQLEIITAPMSAGGPHVRIFDWQGNLRRQFFAYDDTYFGGVNIAVGDVNNDDQDEIITAPAARWQPELRVFDWEHRVISKFLAYDAEMKSGVNVTVGDVNDDGWAEIITVPQKDQIAHVREFSLKGREKNQFVAFNSQLKTGASIIAADLSGDTLPEILVLPNKGSAALLKSYDATGLEKQSFYLRDAADKNGYQIRILKY